MRDKFMRTARETCSLSGACRQQFARQMLSGALRGAHWLSVAANSPGPCPPKSIAPATAPFPLCLPHLWVQQHHRLRLDAQRHGCEVQRVERLVGRAPHGAQAGKHEAAPAAAQPVPQQLRQLAVAVGHKGGGGRAGGAGGQGGQDLGRQGVGDGGIGLKKCLST